MTFDEIISVIENSFGKDIIHSTNESSSPECLEVKPEDLTKVMEYLHETDGLYFDSLSCLTGIDNGPEAGTMEVIYNLYSIPFGHHLMVKVTLDRNQSSVDSLSNIWKTADWHEREAFDLFGIQFTGHPDLRRILLPADWEGHPLKKDYEHQTYYRGIKVAE